MPLLDEAYEKFVYMNKTVVNDPRGGTKTTWSDGAEIDGALVNDNDPEIRVALAQGVKGIYTLITRKNVCLEYHDVIKRVKTGKYFRITSDGEDNATPSSALLDMRKVSCEEWTLNG